MSESVAVYIWDGPHTVISTLIQLGEKSIDVVAHRNSPVVVDRHSLRTA